ncbi:hypothetical protein [Mesorhizobium salmacidum]|uniref:Uncharacterized protein n=1 Tax=Mesorhizobium salmacidum TaxID=3015171 RepID=A0ABU8L204_9HYPH
MVSLSMTKLSTFGPAASAASGLCQERNAARDLGFTDAQSYNDARSGGFTSARAFAQAKSMVFNTRRDHDAAMSGGFRSSDEYQRAQAGGFTAANEYRAGWRARSAVSTRTSASCSAPSSTTNSRCSGTRMSPNAMKPRLLPVGRWSRAQEPLGRQLTDGDDATKRVRKPANLTPHVEDGFSKARCNSSKAKHVQKVLTAFLA